MSYSKEDNGKGSSTRLMFITGMIWAMVTSTLFVFVMDWTAGEFIAVFGSQAGVFIGLKLGQKPMEGKNKKE